MGGGQQSGHLAFAHSNRFFSRCKIGAAVHLDLLAQVLLAGSEPVNKGSHVAPEDPIISKSMCILAIEADQAAEGLPALLQQLPAQLQV